MNDFIEEKIKKVRTANAELTVLKNNKPLAGQEIIITQKKHKFLFGCGGFDLVPLANNELDESDKERIEQMNEKRMEIFNLVILPFYWGGFEARKGEPLTQKLINTAKWCVNHQYRVKGHPLCWHTLAPDWLLPMSNKEILQAQTVRIKREVSGFKGLIDMWDVINEAVIMPVFDKYDNGITRICRELGRIKIIRTMFETARRANPEALFLLNDFDVSSAYDILVEGCLEAGIKIDAIGIQSHMHQGYWGIEKTLRILDHFSRFNLPIHFTENTILSGQLMPPEIVDLNDFKVDSWPSTPEGEERQAEEVLLHYKTLFSHPLVESISWWNLSDEGWLHAPAGIIRKDGTVKPVYDELLKLVKGSWWTKPLRLFTDNEGNANFNGFLGEYELSYQGKKELFHLNENGNAEVTVKI